MEAFIAAKKRNLDAIHDPTREIRVPTGEEDQGKRVEEKLPKYDDEEGEDQLARLGQGKIKDKKEADFTRSKKTTGKGLDMAWEDKEVVVQAVVEKAVESKEPPKKTTANILGAAMGKKKNQMVMSGPDLDAELFPEIGAEAPVKKEQPRPQQTTQSQARTPATEFDARPQFTGMSRSKPQQENSPQVQAQAQSPADSFDARPTFVGKKPTRPNNESSPIAPAQPQEANSKEWDERPTLRNTRKREDLGTPKQEEREEPPRQEENTIKEFAEGPIKFTSKNPGAGQRLQQQEPAPAATVKEEVKVEEHFAEGPVKFISRKAGGLKQVVLTEAQKKELELEQKMEEERKRQLQEIDERRKHPQRAKEEKPADALQRSGEKKERPREEGKPREANGDGKTHKAPRKVSGEGAKRKNSKEEDEEKKEEVPVNLGKFKEFKQSHAATLQGWD